MQEEQIGWVLPHDQPAKLADLILSLQMHPDPLVQMGIRARAAAENKYAPDKVIKSYCNLLEELN